MAAASSPPPVPATLSVRTRFLANHPLTILLEIFQFPFNSLRNITMQGLRADLASRLVRAVPGVGGPVEKIKVQSAASTFFLVRGP